jgi:hypothetical protein
MSYLLNPLIYVLFIDVPWSKHVLFIDVPQSKQGEYLHYDFLKDVKMVMYSLQSMKVVSSSLARSM